VYDVFWVQSKTNNQFVSVSTDGRMLFWDTRKLSEPTDEVVLNDGARTLGGSALEYNIEAGPAKFLVGTEQGIVMSLNMRKAKAGAGKDGKADNSGAISVMDTGTGKHHGPIYSIQRNPFHPINYMTVGDWGVRIWCDGKNKTPIMVRGAGCAGVCAWCSCQIVHTIPHTHSPHTLLSRATRPPTPHSDAALLQVLPVLGGVVPHARGVPLCHAQ
jgi:dynein intermediate chain 2